MNCRLVWDSGTDGGLSSIVDIRLETDSGDVLASSSVCTSHVRLQRDPGVMGRAIRDDLRAGLARGICQLAQRLVDKAEAVLTDDNVLKVLHGFNEAPVTQDPGPMPAVNTVTPV